VDVEKLTVDLRPRPHWQAIDLGFALLRSCAGSVFAAWWSVWSGIALVACAGAFWKPQWLTLWIVLPWASRPALERIVVHILSRGVFGEEVTWKQALRAWPSTLTLDLFHVLTWWRLWALGRSFLQPVWQLEGVTGSVASRRRSALSRKGAGRTAGVWGLACVHLEMVLWIACLTLVGMFTNAAGDLNPFRYMFDSMDGLTDSVHAVVSTLAYALVLGFVGPFYAACGFTLYLNRRAELEAWDIELALRKLARRKSSESSPRPHAPLAKIVALLLIVWAGSARAQSDSCPAPRWWTDPVVARRATTDPRRLEIRREVDSLYRAEARLKEWHCKETWVKKDTSKPERKEPSAFWKELAKALELIGKFIGAHAIWIQWAIIGAAIGLVLWIAWKYRDMVDLGGTSFRETEDPSPLPRRKPLGKEPDLEIDPTDSVIAAWESGNRREALSVLYRLACREAVRSGAVLRKGDTEGSVARSIRQLARENVVGELESALLADTVSVWSRAAWAGAWPTTEFVHSLCVRWRQHLATRSLA